MPIFIIGKVSKMEKNKIVSYLLIISVCTFGALFFYIVQRSYDNLMKPINEAKQSINIKPLDPTLDVDLLDQIAKRNYHP